MTENAFTSWIFLNLNLPRRKVCVCVGHRFNVMLLFSGGVEFLNSGFAFLEH